MKATRRKDQAKCTKQIRVYSYGARIAKADIPQAMDILFKAHRYKNKLTEIIRTFDTQKRNVYPELCPQLRTLNAQIDDLNTRISAVYDENVDQNIKARKRLKDAAAIQKVTELKADRAKLFLEAKKLRSQVARTPEAKAMFTAIGAQRVVAEKTARAECEVYWGTYLLCEEAMKVAENDAASKWKDGWRPKGGRPIREDDFVPGFKRYEHQGSIGVQMQAKRVDGQLTNTTIESVLNGTCQFLQLKPVTAPTQRPSCGLIYEGRIRIGTADDNRTPVWLPFTCKLHRPVPPGSLVLWAKLVAFRVGTHTKWELQLTISNEFAADPKQEREKGLIAIDIGWRKLGSGLRVMYWADDAGRHGEISFPQETLDRLRKVEDLQSIRDKNFNQAKADLRTWMSMAQGMPEWFVDGLLHMEMWRAQARMAAFILKWRQQRFQGDQAIFTLMEAWRAQDKHLLDWQGYQRRGEKKWRKNFYRNVAAKLARGYRRAVIEDFDLRVFSREPDQLEMGDEEIVRYYKNAAGLSEFRPFLKEKMFLLEEAPPEFTTQQCHLCLHTEKFDAAGSITHTCTKCGATWDQDYNACLNLLRLASGGVGGTSQVPLAPSTPPGVPAPAVGASGAAS